MCCPIASLIHIVETGPGAGQTTSSPATAAGQDHPSPHWAIRLRSFQNYLVHIIYSEFDSG
jgi:hypothetical protein